MDISDLQATVTAGSCSSRVVFNVPKARSQGSRSSSRPRRTATSTSPSRRASTTPSCGRRSPRPTPSGDVSVVSGIEEGRRLPTVPKFQLAAAATYQWQVRPGALAYVTGTYQHIGSRFTQVGDEDLGTLNLLSFGAEHDRRAADGEHLHLRPEAAGLRPRQPARRPASRRVGCRAVPQQPDRRAGAAVARPGARHARAHRLPDQPAAHVRHLDAG